MSIRWLVPIVAAIWRRLRSAIPPSRAWRTAAASRSSRACEVLMAERTIWYMFHLVQKEKADGSVARRGGGSGPGGPGGRVGARCQRRQVQRVGTVERERL